MKPHRLIELFAIIIVLGLMFMARPKPVDYNYPDRFQQQEGSIEFSGKGYLDLSDPESARIDIQTQDYDTLFYFTPEDERRFLVTETEEGQLDIQISGYTGMTEAAQDFIGALDGCSCEGGD